MIVDHANMDDFKVGETADDTDCDLPLCFGNQVLTWNDMLFSIISQDNAVTRWWRKGIHFFYGNSKFHVNLMDFPERVYGIHPKQDGWSFEEYLNFVLFHYAMVAYKMDHKQEFNKPETQNIFLQIWIIPNFFGPRYNMSNVLLIPIQLINIQMVIF